MTCDCEERVVGVEDLLERLEKAYKRIGVLEQQVDRVREQNRKVVSENQTNAQAFGALLEERDRLKGELADLTRNQAKEAR